MLTVVLLPHPAGADALLLLPLYRIDVARLPAPFPFFANATRRQVAAADAAAAADEDDNGHVVQDANILCAHSR